ncbi:MAG: esterase family protein [Acidobacteriota bacterium]|nr:esterase family protein [Acidobacteriota bacterium]
MKEIIPLIDGRFRTLAEPAGRAIVGHWTSGIAATHLAFHDAGVFGAAGGEVNDGLGWASWRNRTDLLFTALFPPRQ